MIGSTGKFKWDYSETTDILNIHVAGVRTSGGVEHGDYTVDFDDCDNVVGVEVMYASEHFQGIAKNDFSRLKGATFETHLKNGEMLVLIKLDFGKREAAFALPALVQREIGAAAEA